MAENNGDAFDASEQTDYQPEEAVGTRGLSFGKLRLGSLPRLSENEGIQAVREGLSNFFVANDRGAGRHSSDAERQHDLIREDLERGDLTPEERMERLKMGEKNAQARADNEREAREANERAHTRTLIIIGTALVGVASAAYAIKTGKFPIDPPKA